MRLRYDFVVAGYVIMPEHVHLLVSEPKKAVLSKALQALKLSVSVQSKPRPFWQVRSYDFNVYSPGKRSEKIDYMHRNPVKRGWWQTRSTGHGPVTAITRRASEEPWKSSLNGLPPGGIVLRRKPMSQMRDMGHPSLWRYRQTWATRPSSSP
jgi:hypothetical protein